MPSSFGWERSIKGSTPTLGFVRHPWNVLFEDSYQFYYRFLFLNVFIFHQMNLTAV